MKPAKQLTLTTFETLDQFVNNLRAVIIPFSTITASASGEHYIGIGRELSEAETQARAFVINQHGHRVGINSDIGSKIIKLIQQDKTTVTPDGAGVIHTDPQGNRLVSFADGIGPIGSSMGLIADLQTSYDSVKSYITVNLTEHQALAIASFVNSVGAETFVSSSVLELLNSKQYQQAAHSFRNWVLNADGSENIYLVAQREFEYETFMTPASDSIGVVGNRYVVGEYTYQDLADHLRIMRSEK